MPLQVQSHDGIDLVCDQFGDNAPASVIFAHGGGQTRHAWKKAAESIADKEICAVTFDLRGHGDSGWAPEGKYSLEDFGADLLSIAKVLPKPIHVVGASLGGMSAMVAAGYLDREAFSSVTLVDVTPTMEIEGILKVVGFMSAHLKDGFGSIEEAAEVIAEYLPHRPKPKDLRGLSKNLRQREDGRYRWHWDPDFMSGMWTAGQARPRDYLKTAVTNIDVPIHLIRGGQSELVSAAAVKDFLELVPHAAFSDVAGAGHMVAGDKNDAFVEAVENFIVEVSLRKQNCP